MYPSVFMVKAITEQAKDWVDENLQLEDWQWLGDMFSVEWRYIEDLESGMEGDGLVRGTDYEVVYG